MALLKYRTQAQRHNGNYQLVTLGARNMEEAIKAAIGIAGGREIKDMKVLELHEYHPDGMVRMLDVLTGTEVIDPGKGIPAKDEPEINAIIKPKSPTEIVQETIDAAIEREKQLALVPEPSLEDLEKKVGIVSNVSPLTQVKLRGFTLVELATVAAELPNKRGFGGRDG